MQWRELDLKAGTWTLPPERRKTGNKDPRPFALYLPPEAVKVLRSQPRLEGQPHVFWGRRDKQPFDFQHLMLGRVRADSEVDDRRIHDIRRVVRTGMARLGVTEAVAEQCLGHRIKGESSNYDTHDYAREMKDAWRKWARELAKIVK